MTVISYRSFKKLLGETSLERKCRFLFGIALLIMITASFWTYATRTRRLVESQQLGKAEALIPEILFREHIKRVAKRMSTALQTAAAAQSVLAAGGGLSLVPTPLAVPVTGPDENSRGPEAASETQPPSSGSPAHTGPLASNASPWTRNDPWTMIGLNWKQFQEHMADADELKLVAQWGLLLATDTPARAQEFDAMQEFQQGASEKHFFENDDQGTRYLNYYKAVRASQSCLDCHNGKQASSYELNALVGMATVRMSLASVEVQLSHNRIILLASGIVTTFIAMLVAYIIVRYIIVKPVLHLKDVSDEIARGNLNLRAEINTGDEFEELSHAFNRMLRHMTTVNDELRGLNDHLDSKVDQLAQANLELFNNNALKDEFLATMSHELRTPLNSILGFSDVLAGAQNLDDRQKRYVENIRTSGRSLMVQINDLLDLAKIESGQMKVQLSPLQLKDLIENQISQIMPLADQKNIELRVRHPDLPLPMLMQDAGKLRQILTNLLSNAIKFTPEGGRVRISYQALDPDQFEICVEDTGIGIPMHEQATIFEKFRQGTTTSGQRDHMKREYGGTGLGLSIVRELARLLGGDVYLESEFGKGSAFMIRLPREAREELPQPVLLESPSSTGLNRITSVDLLNPGKRDAAEPAASGAGRAQDDDSDINEQMEAGHA
ncbi:MAG: ATP-binding protein [Planctomycetaceae bacterium]